LNEAVAALRLAFNEPETNDGVDLRYLEAVSIVGEGRKSGEWLKQAGIFCERLMRSAGDTCKSGLLHKVIGVIQLLVTRFQPVGDPPEKSGVNHQKGFSKIERSFGD
jgi:hypothetical protein